MDIRAGQGPLMPTLPHPMGMGLPPTHLQQQLGVGQPHHLGLPYQPTGININQNLCRSWHFCQDKRTVFVFLEPWQGSDKAILGIT